MLLNITAFLQFSSLQPVTMKFNSPIEYHSIGNDGDFETYKTKDKKILLIKPKLKEFDTFLVVITKNTCYQFHITSTSERKSVLYQIKDGKIDLIYKEKKRTPKYKVLEGEHSIKIVNLTKSPLLINQQSINQNIVYFPKGANLHVNNDNIY